MVATNLGEKVAITFHNPTSVGTYSAVIVWVIAASGSTDTDVQAAKKDMIV